MIKNLSLASIVLSASIVVVGTGCHSSSDNPPSTFNNAPAPTPAALTVNGLVLNAATSLPIGSATVTIKRQDGTTVLTKVTTDSAGAFS